MGDLRIKDLVVEYASGGYAVRPINGLNLDVATGSLVILLGPERLREDDPAVLPGRDSQPKSAGRIEFDDIDLTSLDAGALANYRRDTVGIVFQAFNLVPA